MKMTNISIYIDQISRIPPLDFVLRIPVKLTKNQGGHIPCQEHKLSEFEKFKALSGELARHSLCMLKYQYDTAVEMR